MIEQVTYQADLFLDKNKDFVIAEHQALLNASQCPFTANLFPPLPEETTKQSKSSSIGTRFKVKLNFHCLGAFDIILRLFYPDFLLHQNCQTSNNYKL